MDKGRIKGRIEMTGIGRIVMTGKGRIKGRIKRADRNDGYRTDCKDGQKIWLQFGVETIILLRDEESMKVPLEQRETEQRAKGVERRFFRTIAFSLGLNKLCTFPTTKLPGQFIIVFPSRNFF